jgi:hypothetical protein
MTEKETHQLPIKCSTMKKINGVIETVANICGFGVAILLSSIMGIALGLAFYAIINNPGPGGLPLIARIVIGVVLLAVVWILVDLTFMVSNVKFTCIKDEETK